MVEVRYERGLYLPRQHLWLDPREPKKFAFVSHAHIDHIAPHEEVILSEPTSRLLQSRLPGKRVERILPFNETRTIRDVVVTLLPAGHVFGSAQLFISSREGTLLYTGDFKLRPGKSAEPAQWREAQTLILETTFGRPRYQFPSAEKVVGQIVAFCHDTLDEGAVPVLLGYSLGKAQEILCGLEDAELIPMLHGSVYEMTRIYEDLGKTFCNYVRYQPNDVAGKVLICPPSANGSPMLEKIPAKRVAMISGWAVDPGAIYRYQVDAAFPLSDHADYNDLLRYVDLVKPEHVLTVHGFAADFARDLRERGIDAWALSVENQMELNFIESTGVSPAAVDIAQAADVRQDARAPKTEFSTFADVGESIGAAPAKLEKIRLLAGYLRSLNVEQLPIAATYFTGRVFAQSDPRSLQVGSSIIYRAIKDAADLSDEEFRGIAHRHGDASKTAFEALDGRTTPKPFTLTESSAFFEALQEARGPILKQRLLQERLSILFAQEGQYVVKLLTGDLRIGLREGLVEEAIASAFEVPLDDVREGNMLLGNIGATAALAARHELDRAELSIFRPIKCMLATPEPTAEAIWARFVEAVVPGGRRTAAETMPAMLRDRDAGAAAVTAIYAEDKFDGIRAQLHRTAQRSEIFSRDLRRITDQFPELADRAQNFTADLILDGEIVAFEETRKLTFFDLQKRLGRKNEGADLFSVASANVPVAFIAFDLLWLNGQSLLKKPLRRRRELLRTVQLPPQFRVAEIFSAKSAAEIEQIFQQARRRLNEGIMVKDPESAYLPGSRGRFWFKLKKELATLDVVVVAVERGHGKRNNVLSDYTFAVRDENSGELLPIGKAYSGLTDGEIATLTAHFDQNTIIDHGRYREVKPDIVLEVAFNSIQPSTRHSSGLALRFPRIKAIRRDKTVDAIDTLQYARELMNSMVNPNKQ
jgi:DNA ligase-1